MVSGLVNSLISAWLHAFRRSRLSVSYRETICHAIYMLDPLREDLVVLLAVGVATGALGIWVILAVAQ